MEDDPDILRVLIATDNHLGVHEVRGVVVIHLPLFLLGLRTPAVLAIHRDNVAGCAQEDAIRKNDSFNAFEEILQHAQRLKVDALFLGGDLFHDNKPSRCALCGSAACLPSGCA